MIVVPDPFVCFLNVPLMAQLKNIAYILQCQQKSKGSRISYVCHFWKWKCIQKLHFIIKYHCAKLFSKLKVTFAPLSIFGNHQKKLYESKLYLKLSKFWKFELFYAYIYRNLRKYSAVAIVTWPDHRLRSCVAIDSSIQQFRYWTPEKIE